MWSPFLTELDGWVEMMAESTVVNYDELRGVVTRLTSMGDTVQGSLERMERARQHPDLEQSVPLSEDSYWAAIRATEPVRRSMIGAMNEMRTIYWATRAIVEGFEAMDSKLATQMMVSGPGGYPYPQPQYLRDSPEGDVFGPRTDGELSDQVFWTGNAGPETWLKLDGEAGFADGLLIAALLPRLPELVLNGVLSVVGWGVEKLVGAAGEAMARAIERYGMEDKTFSDSMGTLETEFAREWVSSLRPESIAGDVYAGLEEMLAGLGDSYDTILNTVPDYLKRFGLFPDGYTYLWKDPSWRPDVTEILSGKEFAANNSSYLQRIKEAYGDKVRYEPTAPILDEQSLLLRLGELDSVGQNRTAQVETVVNEGPPASMIVLIPSTQEWSPTESSRIPNDLGSNLQVMANGESDLLYLAEAAIRARIDELPEDQRANLKIMTAGFSQGGIVAAQIAQRANFNVTQVLTAGAPVGRILEEMPGGVNVVSLEQPHDPVVNLDGRENPQRPGFLTYRPAQDGLFVRETSSVLSHDVLRYSLIAEDLDAEHLAVRSMRNNFLGPIQDQKRYVGNRR